MDEKKRILIFFFSLGKHLTVKMIGDKVVFHKEIWRAHLQCWYLFRSFSPLKAVYYLEKNLFTCLLFYNENCSRSYYLCFMKFSSLLYDKNNMRSLIFFLTFFCFTLFVLFFLHHILIVNIPKTKTVVVQCAYTNTQSFMHKFILNKMWKQKQPKWVSILNMRQLNIAGFQYLVTLYEKV